jgi:SPP1 gp7 family putative phage head morphogenesis protein
MPTKKPKLKYSNDQIEKYIQGIYDGDITQKDIPKDLYLAIADYLKEGLYDGYGMTLAEAEGPDLDLLILLRDNVYMFSAAKTYVETKEISSLLVSDEGRVLSFKEFKEEALKLYDIYNETYLETEYSTAIGQGYAAQKWNDIEQKKETLPILEYKAISDPCDICEPLDGLTAPVDDPIWDSIAPLNHFNCRCILVQHDDEEKVTPDGEKEELYSNARELMQPTFKSNPGKDGMVFNESHPYFEEASQDKASKDNFDLPIPKKDK